MWQHVLVLNIGRINHVEITIASLDYVNRIFLTNLLQNLFAYAWVIGGIFRPIQQPTCE